MEPIELYNFVENLVIENPDCSHIIMSESHYEVMVRALGAKNPISRIDFYGKETIVTNVPINEPRALYIKK